MQTIYYTAATLDGFLADEQDSLDWLFVQDDQGQGFDYDEFIGNVGVVVTGATTYDWVRANHDGPWPYEQPTFVFSHAGRVADEPHVHSVAGEVQEHWAAIRAAASGKNVWVVGGGDLAAQFAEAGHLDQLWLSIAPVTLGTGRPLLSRPRDLELVECRKAGDFICAVYNVDPRALPDSSVPSTTVVRAFRAGVANGRRPAGRRHPRGPARATRGGTDRR